MISSLSNYCVIIGCLEYRWKGDPINLCVLHYEIEVRDKKLKEINDLMEKADLCDCDWEPACQECLEAWIEAKRLSS